MSTTAETELKSTKCSILTDANANGKEIFPSELVEITKTENSNLQIQYPTTSNAVNLNTSEDSNCSLEEKQQTEKIVYVNCGLCSFPLTNPRFLSCLHAFCEACLKKTLQDKFTNITTTEGSTIGDGAKKLITPNISTLTCAVCSQVTKIGKEGIESLLSGNGFKCLMNKSAPNKCFSCGNMGPIESFCKECRAELCATCVSAHRLLCSYENHNIVKLSEASKRKLDRPLPCPQHKGAKLCFYCFNCQVPICMECFRISHSEDQQHHCDIIAFAEKSERSDVELLMNEATTKANSYNTYLSISNALVEMQEKNDIASNNIVETYNSLELILSKCRDIAMTNLDKIYEDKKEHIQNLISETDTTKTKIENISKETQSFLNNASTEELLVKSKTVSYELKNLIEQANVDADNKSILVFEPEIEKFCAGISECFGKLQITENVDADTSGLQTSKATVETKNTDTAFTTSSPVVEAMRGTFEANISSFESSFCILNDITHSTINGTQKLSDSSVKDSSDKENLESYKKLASNSQLNVDAPIFCMRPQPAMKIVNTLRTSPKQYYPTNDRRVNFKKYYDSDCVYRNTDVDAKPLYVRLKLGSYGSNNTQLNVPHGFCINNEDDIIVADTNNHRIVICDKYGNFKHQFGVPGKEEGQLWYPRKVCILPTNKKFIVCDRGSERSRMQIFTKNGLFLRKISIRYIDIVAGLAVTSKGHIVAVDSVFPTVFIISEDGDLLYWFDCNEYMCEPSDVAVKNSEIFISDYKGHSVSVFSEEGAYLYRIGGPDVTCFPNGLDISTTGNILVCDSHGNRFHVNCFLRSGKLVSRFECPIFKVSRCCGLKITSEGYLITLAKNNNNVLMFSFV